MKIKIYGSRGSMPFFSRSNIRYGGNTPCVRLDIGEHTVLLDCGSGLMQFQEEFYAGAQAADKKLDILIGHLHFDHIIGLSGFAQLWQPNNNVRIYTVSRSAKPLVSQIFGAFKPPYWPVELEYMNKAELVEITDGFTLHEGITVTPFMSNHQNITTAFRIDADKSLVYMLDCELAGAELEPLAEYCKNADLIIFDSAYMPEDYADKRGWGHSSFTDGIHLAEVSQCKQMMLAHFSMDYSDAMLDKLANSLDSEKFILAYDGLELTL